MGMARPKKWSGQNLIDLTGDYGPATAADDESDPAAVTPEEDELQPGSRVSII